MWILSRAGHVHVRFDRALNIRDLVGQSLNDAKAERTAVEREINAIVRTGRLDVPSPWRVSSFGTHCEERRRKVPLRSDPLVPVLLQPGIHGDPARLVAERAAKRLIRELSEAAVVDLKLSIHNRM